MLAVGAQLAVERVAGVDLVLLRQKFHREMNALQLAPRYRQVTRQFRPASQQNGVEILQQLRGADLVAGPVGDPGFG